MTIQGMQPEVEERLRELAEARRPPDSKPIDQVIDAFLRGARDRETAELARQVLTTHREFFDLNGDR